jgi:virulence factor Mce-like protein
VPVGTVRDVALTGGGLARVTVLLQPGVDVTRGTTAQISRRSPIGDLTLDLTPGSGPPLPEGAHIGVADTLTPPDPEKTIEALAAVLHAVPSKDLGSLVNTLAVALRGRGEDLATLSVASADLPQRLLQVRQQLQALIETGPKLTGVLADNASTLADDISQTKELADILRDRRYDLVDLSKNGTKFAEVAGGILNAEKPNLACLLADLGDINATLAEPGNLASLAGTLDLNHYFFDGVWQSVQVGLDKMGWFRVDLLPPQQPSGRAYDPMRPTPDVYAGNSCRTQYGAGVGAGSQPGPVYIAPGSKLHRGA